MVAYVTGGVILGALGWYAPLVNFAGCGATVPLSGFGYLLSEGVKAAVKEKGILGVFTAESPPVPPALPQPSSSAA